MKDDDRGLAYAIAHYDLNQRGRNPFECGFLTFLNGVLEDIQTTDKSCELDALMRKLYSACFLYGTRIRTP